MRGTHPVNKRAAKPPSVRKQSGPPDSLPAAPALSSSLHASVLVLNRLYMAVHVIGVRRAFALLCRELAEVIHADESESFGNYTFETWLEASQEKVHVKQPHEDWIRSVNFEIQVPRVIRLLHYDRLPKQGVHLNRRNVLARDGHQCQYCGRRLPIHQLSLDHVMPRSRGGPTTWENIVCAVPGIGRNVRKKAGPDSARSQNEIGPPAGETQAQPYADSQIRESQIRKLADLAGRRFVGNRRAGLKRLSEHLDPFPRNKRIAIFVWGRRTPRMTIHSSPTGKNAAEKCAL